MNARSDAPLSPAAILADPASSYWLKDALRSALDRDPIDAAADAELLAHVLKDRANRALALHTL